MPSGLSARLLEAVASLGLAATILFLQANSFQLSTVTALAVSLVPYMACLWWGVPHSAVGSWSLPLSVAHRVSGIGTLILPLLLVVYEAMTGCYAPAGMLVLTVSSVALNLALGAALIPRRIPAYDIPTLRAFAVGVLLGWAFLSLSLLFCLGPSDWYEPVGRAGAWLSLYSVIFAWVDALQHAYQYCRGNFKTHIGESRDVGSR